ncbi:MAG: drug/metabolite transporter (DMT)-like permease [Myxococcota bacterium]|jgi:drug/metabolite transporter (DMT)-like permease
MAANKHHTDGGAMAAIFALLSAATWSVSDFLGGLATQRANSLMVTFVSQIAGVSLLVILLPAMGIAPTAEALWIGAIAGIGGSGGLLFYFKALAIGPMGVTAPVAAVVGAAVPVIVGLSLGERPGTLALCGIAVAIVGTTLASRPGPATATTPDSSPNDTTRARRGAAAAAMGGVLFGLFFVAIASVPDGAGLWPLLTARAAGITMLSVPMAIVRPARLDRRGLRLSLGAGVLDMAANSLFLAATQVGGLLVLTAVLASLYPVGVVALAAFVLHERLSRGQWIGAALAIAAVILIAV